MALPAETRSAFFDELSKIAQDELKKTEPKWKRIAKAGLLSAAGLTAGYSAGMLVDEGLRRTIGKSYPNWSPAMKYKVLYPISGALGLGMMAAQQYAGQRYKKRVEGDE